MTERRDHFATTQWTLVLAAAQEDSLHGRPALEELFQRYWQPLYAFARRRGMSAEDAEDATQEFLGGIINGHLLQAADPARGRFRSFLLKAWQRYLVDQYRRRKATKRGGGQLTLSLDFASSERRWQELESRAANPESAFTRIWADRVLVEAKQRLREEYVARNRLPLWEAFLPLLTKQLQSADYDELARRLGLSASAVKVGLHRMRQRFGRAVRDVVAETVDHPSEVDQELAELLDVFRHSPSDLA